MGIAIFYFYSADQAKIRGFAFGNEIQALQEEIQVEQGKFLSSIAKWEEGTISDDDMIRIGEKSNLMSKMLAYLLEELYLHQVRCWQRDGICHCTAKRKTFEGYFSARTDAKLTSA